MGSQEIGFGSSSSSTGVNGASTEEILTPYLEIITKFRESIRKEALESKQITILKECDAIRNDLGMVGVRLSDEKSGCTWKFEDPETFRKEMEVKAMEEQRKKEEKQAKAKVEAEREARNKIPPQDLFRSIM